MRLENPNVGWASRLIALRRRMGVSQTELGKQPETVLAAPSSWCPNPAYTSCLRVRGRSMIPLLHDGYIIVVDKSQTYRKKLYGQIVVAAHNEQGLIVSRLQRFDGTEVLVPENREYDSIAISSASWRIVAKILWWIGRASEGERLKEAA